MAQFNHGEPLRITSPGGVVDEHTLDVHAADVHSTGAHATDLRTRPGPAFLIYLHIVICCVSLVYVARFYVLFHIDFQDNQLYRATAAIALCALISPLFTLARFSFGYYIGFYLYTAVVGFIWLSFFTPFSYDQETARLSAVLSIIALLLPGLLITSPIRQIYVISPRQFERLPIVILFLAAATIAAGASYGFRLVGISDIYSFRGDISYPKVIEYATGIVSNALLPFAFACFVERGKMWFAAISVLLALLFYPITLSKLALLLPIWLVVTLVLSRLFEARTAVVLSILIPLLVGIVLIDAMDLGAILYFGTVNFRAFAIPSSALDHYNHFFSTHALTYFCQLSFLKEAVSCPYDDQLSVVMQDAYRLGNFNASLLATEGIASLGLKFAPVSVLICGFILGLANRLSAGLPDRFILLSGAAFPQILLNIPLTTSLLTHGAVVLFLLWYIVPRTNTETAGTSS
jgi:hypothetical protein